MSQSNKQKVIIITTFFPPIQSIACNRMVAFAKYLNKDLFDVHVVTLESHIKENFELHGVSVHRIENSPFFKLATFHKPTPVFIRRIKSLYNKVYSYLTFKVNYNWQKKCIKKLKSLLLDSTDSVLISSYSPVEAHLIPLELRKQGFKFKWIADFRDEMSLNPYNKANWHNKIVKIEKEILSKIDALSTISGIFIERFKRLNTRDSVLYKEVRNGFDFEYNKDESGHFNEEFTVNYVGNIYSSIDLSSFYHAVENIVENNLIPDLKINLIGVGKTFRLPKKYSDVIKLTDKFPHNKAIEIMKSSDALLFILPNIGWTGVYSGKLFEYLGSRRPIIALTDPTDVAAKLIVDCNAGFIADSNKTNEVIKAFVDAYQLWKDKKTLKFNDELINQHHRKNQVKNLEELILELNQQKLHG